MTRQALCWLWLLTWLMWLSLPLSFFCHHTDTGARLYESQAKPQLTIAVSQQIRGNFEHRGGALFEIFDHMVS